MDICSSPQLLLLFTNFLSVLAVNLALLAVMKRIIAKPTQIQQALFIFVGCLIGFVVSKQVLLPFIKTWAKCP